jgi:hypothetical protein
MAFELISLIDYEAQLARDESRPLPELSTREARIQERILSQLADKRAALLAWLRELKLGEGPWPGAALVRAYEALVFILFLVGSCTGAGAIHVFLRYDGAEPVNVIPIIGFYGLLQILLVLWYLLKSSLARAFRKLPGGALIALLSDLGKRWLQRRPELVSARNLDSRIETLFLRRLRELHGALLTAKAWQAFQVFGLAFHLASLVTFLMLIAFDDYTFAWRTTLQLNADILHRIVAVLAFPFSGLSEGLSPSLALVEASRFDRFEKGFLQGQALMTKGWWPFLAALIAVYGLIPRLIFWGWLKSFGARYLRRYTPRDFTSESLWQRLCGAQTGWDKQGVESPRPIPDQALASVSRLQEKTCVLVLWRDVDVAEESARALLKRAFNLRVRDRVDAKGLAKDGSVIVDRLLASDCLVFLTDPFEMPGEAVDRIRRAVRERYSDLLVLFAPLHGTGEGLSFAGDKDAWRHALKIYRDPYLGLLEDA